MDIIPLFVILQTVVTQAAGDFCESNRQRKWKNSVTKCNMAMPDLHLTPAGYSANIEYDITMDEVWLGYFMRMTVFEYMGCVEIDEEKHKAINLTTQHSSPGMCYTKCRGKEIIGVSIDKCICLDTVENYLEQECTTPCSQPGSQDILCGSQGYMSVYKINKKETAGDRRLLCLIFEEIGSGAKTFTWNGCLTNLPILCDNGTRDLNERSTNMEWKKSVGVCIQKGLRPTLYQGLKQIQQTVSPSWSGVISSDVIYSYKEWNTSYTDIRFGYMKADKTVHFEDTNTKKSILCNRSTVQTTPLSTSVETSWTTINNSATTSTQAEQHTTSTPLPSSITTSSTATSSRVNSVATTSTSIQVSAEKSTTSSTTDAFFADHTSENERGQDVSVVIGVSVSAILIVAAVVIAFVFLKRRQQIPDLCKRMAKTKNADNDISLQDEVVLPSKVNIEYMAIAAHSNAGKDITLQDEVVLPSKVDDERMANAAHPKQGEYYDVDNIDDSSYAHTYLVLDSQDNDNETYDTTGHGKDKANENDNVYNKLNDHVESDNDYDTTEKAAMKFKAGVEKLPGDYSYIDNDDYSHINSKSLTTGQTDNTYNIPDQYNCSGSDGTSFDKEDQDENDTYSHINGRQVNSYFPDSAYGVPYDGSSI